MLPRWRYAESLKSEANGAANGKHSQNHSQDKEDKEKRKDDEDAEDEGLGAMSGRRASRSAPTRSRC